MESAKNKAIIGAFVVGAVALAFTGVMVLGGGEFFKKKLTRVMYFEESVKGLKVGAPVVYRGVEIGAVKEIAIHTDTEKLTFKIPVIVEIDPSIYGDPDLAIDSEKALSLLIERGLRAKLEIQSLVTGMLQVSLDVVPGTTPRMVGGKSPYSEIPTVPSGMEKFSREIQDIPIKDVFANLSATLSALKDFVDSPKLQESVVHLNETLMEIKKLVQRLEVGVAESAQQMIQHADRMIQDIDGRSAPFFVKADQALDNIAKLVADVDKIIKPLAKSVEGTVKSIRETSDTARPAIKNIGQASANIASMTGKNAPERERLDDTLKELSAAARAIKNWADYLERHPEALLRGKAGPGQRR